MGKLAQQKSPEFYKYYPKLFASYYQDVSKKTLNQLNKAGYLYYQATLQMDELVDEGNLSVLPEMIVLQEEVIKSLTEIYGTKSKFWDCWELRRAEYFEGLRAEKNLQMDSNISFETYSKLADQKSAFGKVAIDSLNSLTHKNNNSVYHQLLLSHKHFSTGLQLYDDVKDFKEDYLKKQFNWAFYQLNKIIDFQKFELEKFHKLLFIKGIGQDILRQAINQFDISLEIIKNLSINSDWEQILKETKTTIESYLNITNGYLSVLKTRLELKQQINLGHPFFKFDLTNNKTLKKGLDFIKSDFDQNYSDLKHLMFLPGLEGFENEDEIHITDTFQRALINDCFISITKKLNLDISDFLLKECEYLISKRNNDEIGAWSYFPTVKEIAADIDDLGQIMQLFINANHKRFVDAYCKKAISITLKDRCLTNGSFETWIINQNNQTEIQQKQVFFNETKWGLGPDLEVVANFIYALLLYDEVLYKEVILDALTYIINKQNLNGYWESRWYFGKFYGTYVTLRLLKQFEIDFPYNIKLALDFIKSSQNADGGFGLKTDYKSDPLSTSLAILSLKLFLNQADKCINNAESYLINTQDVSGFWPAVDFIMPRIGETYKSKALTTAFVLKALC